MKYSVLNPGIVAVVPKVLELLLCVEHNSQLFLLLSWKYSFPVGFDHLRHFKLGTGPGERWWPRAAKRTRRACRTPPTKPTSHLRPSRPTGPLLEAAPLVFDSLVLVWKQWQNFLWLNFHFNGAQKQGQSETNIRTTLIVKWDNKPKAYPEVWVWTIERVDASF